MGSSWKGARVAALAVATAALAAGCGSSSDDDATSTAAKTTRAATSGVVAEAQAELTKLAPKTDPVLKVDPLSKPVPKGKTMTYITCPVPVCVEVAKGVKAATDTVGWKLKLVNEGLTPASIQSAFSNVAQQPTDAVGAVGVLPNTAVKQQLTAPRGGGGAERLPVALG
jgi:ribose transport system substrate-binding protein